MRRAAHTGLGPDRQLTVRIPLILGIVGRPIEFPIGERATSRDLTLQTLAVGAELSIREVLAAHFEKVVDELIRDVAAVFIDLDGLGRQGKPPTIGCHVDPTEFIVMWVVHGIIAVAAVDYRPSECISAVQGCGDWLGLVECVGQR